MRYVCGNLNLFDLHDAPVSDVRFFGRDLVWTLRNVNALRDCPANPHGVAMRAPKARLVMTNCRIEKLAVCAHKTFDVQNQALTDVVPAREIPSAERGALLLRAREINCARQDGDAAQPRVSMIFLSRPDLVEAELVLDGLRLEWDAYDGPARFERPRPAPPGAR